MYSITDLKNDLEGVLHGTTNNQIQNLDGVINRAARQLLLDLDPQETRRTVEFISPVFNSVYDYPIAADVKGNKIIDIFPQVNRVAKDIWSQSYDQAFDVAKQSIFSLKNMFNLDFNSGLKTIRVNAPYLNPPVIVNNIDSITDNGTWAVGGDANTLTLNNKNFVQGTGSLEFNVSFNGIGYIENSDMVAVDLSNVAFQSSLFVNVYVPVATNLNSVQLRWGSSPTDYYAVTVTQTQQGTVFVNGWNLCQFNWENATITGNPDNAAINYARVAVNMNNINTGVKINGLNSTLGTILSYSYYSKFMFKDSATGVFQETVTDDSNLVNLDTESYNLLFNQVAFLASQQQQGVDSGYDGTFFKNAYDDGLARYKAMYKSELQKPQSSYYPMNKAGYSKIIGRGFRN